MRGMKIAYEMTLPYKPTRKFMKAAFHDSGGGKLKKNTVGWWR